jgi:hypothetical protein
MCRSGLGRANRSEAFRKVVLRCALISRGCPTNVFLREESRLATNHLLATAEVEWSKGWGRRRRGTEVKYHFVALDGRSYEETSNGFGHCEFKPKDAIPILYNPLMPTNNKPLAGFILYRFEGCS